MIVRRGTAEQVEAERGNAGLGLYCAAMSGWAGHGNARNGSAWIIGLCRARRGVVMQGAVRLGLLGNVWRGKAMRGMAWIMRLGNVAQGGASSGGAWIYFIGEVGK